MNNIAIYDIVSNNVDSIVSIYNSIMNTIFMQLGKATYFNPLIIPFNPFI